MSRRDINAFATALDSVGGATPGDQLQSLVAVARQFPVLPVRAPATFRASLREQLVAAVDAPAPSSWLRLREILSSWRVRHASRLALAGVALLLVLGSAVVATDRSVPGSRLYAAKRATESLQLRLARSDSARADVRLGHARERLREFRVIAGRDPSAHTSAQGRRLLGDMDDDVMAAATLSKSPQSRSELRAFAISEYAALAAILPALAPVEAARAQQSLALLADIGNGAGPASLPAGPVTSGQPLPLPPSGPGGVPSTSIDEIGPPGASAPPAGSGSPPADEPGNGQVPSDEAPAPATTGALPNPAPGQGSAGPRPPVLPVPVPPLALPTPTPTAGGPEPTVPATDLPREPDPSDLPAPTPTPTPSPSDETPTPDPDPSTSGVELPTELPALPAPLPTLPVTDPPTGLPEPPGVSDPPGLPPVPQLPDVTTDLAALAAAAMLPDLPRDPSGPAEPAAPVPSALPLP